MLLPYLTVALGGAFGAMARYVMILFAQNIWGLQFPYGTLIVNTTGSFVAGFILTFMVGIYSGEESWRLFIFTGFLGAYTTFSSFAAESMFLYQRSQWMKLVANVVLNNMGALLMVVLGSMLAQHVLTSYIKSN